MPVRYRDGVPVYGYDVAPHVPPVLVYGLDPHKPPGGGRHHIHEFGVIVTSDSAAWIVHPGTVIDPSTAGIEPGAVAIAFDLSAVDQALLPFSHPHRDDGIVRVDIPAAQRARWHDAVAALQSAMIIDDPYRARALVAHLTVLLIELRRGSPDDGEQPEALMQSVFDTIEARFAEPLALRDVARAVGVSPGYLTTRVRRLTGRPVQVWITERRMVEARRLLAETDWPVARVGRAIGIADPAYFSRVFARTVGVPPRRWRAARRLGAGPGAQ